MRGFRTFAAFCLLAVTAACAPAPATTPTTPAQTGSQAQPTAAPQAFTLKVGVPSIAATLDAHAIIGSTRRYGIWAMLLNQDENGKIIPDLATEWKNINPTTWQFKLAQGRKFADGNPITAEDIVFSWKRAIDPNNKFGITGRLLSIADAQVVDPQTVNIITKTPDGLMLKRAAAVVIMEKAWVEKQQPSDLVTKAIGSGPFTVKEFVASDRAVLVPNPYYTPKPAVSEITFRQIPDASARVAGLKTGELDIISTVPINQADPLKAAGNQIINFNQGNTSGAILFTVLPDQPQNNVLVRQAMNYAIDKDAIVKNVYLGYPAVASQLVQKASVGYNPNLKPYPYDPAKAKQLLAQAGYPNGFKTKIDVYVSSAEIQNMFLLVQSQFKDVGIDAELVTSTDPQFNTDRFYGRVARNPIFQQGLNNSPALDADFAISWFYSKRVESERWYINPEFDKAYEASTAELDPAKREVLLQQAVQILRDDAAFLYLIDGVTLWASGPSFQNFIARGESEPKYELITKK